jgi:dihydroorotate dehydrogenase
MEGIPDDKSLSSTVFGREFSNPIGLAAGFDKDGKVANQCHDLGFGFVEIGSITPEPQPGNDKPRVFRLNEDNAIINRYSFSYVRSFWFLFRAIYFFSSSKFDM